MDIKKLSVTTCFSLATLAVLVIPSVVRAEPGVRLKGNYNFGGIESPDVRAKAKAAEPAARETFVITSISPNSDSVIVQTPIGPVRLDVKKGKPQKKKKIFPQAELYNTALESEPAKFQQAT